MSEVVENRPAKQDAPAAQPPTDSEGHPVREWIDTLLQAAVIAKDKQKKPVPGATTTATTDAVDAATATAAASDTKAAVANDATPKNEDIEAEEKTEATPGPDTIAETKLEAETHDKATSASAPKRYRRRRCEVEGCTKFARFNNACSAHGGRRLCGEAGCERVAQFGHKCSAHGGIKFCSSRDAVVLCSLAAAARHTVGVFDANILSARRAPSPRVSAGHTVAGPAVRSKIAKSGPNATDTACATQNLELKLRRHQSSQTRSSSWVTQQFHRLNHHSRLTCRPSIVAATNYCYERFTQQHMHVIQNGHFVVYTTQLRRMDNVHDAMYLDGFAGQCVPTQLPKFTPESIHLLESYASHRDTRTKIRAAIWMMTK
ncbi:hypothetical protein GQ600_11079 [Phytophthora cactorum]|nr:hypothetical protein GQ600_11079 [Phytophthora cactorum]